MQPLWYGDRRDRVKWGALLHLASRFELSPIIQVAYWRDKTGKTLQIGTRRATIPIPAPVWNHFSDLRNIERLGQATGKHVIVIDESFVDERHEYSPFAQAGRIERYFHVGSNVIHVYLPAK